MSSKSGVFESEQLKPNEAFIVALLCFVSTLYFSPGFFILSVPLSLFVFKFQFLKQAFRTFIQGPFEPKYIRFVWFPVLIVLSSLLNKLVFGLEIKGITDGYTPLLLLPISLLSAYFFSSRKLVFWFVVFVSIEVVIGVLEYFFNVRSFFVGSSAANEIVNKTLLYNSRVFGLSVNSSLFGIKLFIALLLIDFSACSVRLKWGLRFVLLVGVILSFNRAVIVGLFIYWALTLVYALFKNRRNVLSILKNDALQFALILVTILLVFNSKLAYHFSRGEKVERLHYYEEKQVETVSKGLVKVALNDFDKEEDRISKDTSLLLVNGIDYASIDPNKQIFVNQQNAYKLKNDTEIDTSNQISQLFLKLSNGTNTSGRKLIWLNYISFIDTHVLFGNGSDKLMFWELTNDKIEVVHAHNSYLEFIGTNGLLITLLFFIFLFFLWRKKNVVLIISILVFSIFQYGIFWGISLLDIVFLAALISPLNYTTFETSRSHT